MSLRVLAALVVSTSAVAGALPVLRLGLGGDAQALGQGGVQPYEDVRAAAWRLERPALLADEVRPALRFSAENESTIEISGKQAWAGTSAKDFRSRATWVQPFAVKGVPVAIAASGRFETGHLRLRNTKDGVLFDVDERRSALQAAIGVRPRPWLRLGGAAAVGLGRAYGLEGAIVLPHVEIGFVRRAEELAYHVSSPPGPQARFQRPAIVYDVSQTRQIGAATLAIRLPWLVFQATSDVLHPGDHVVDAAVPIGPVTARGRWEATGFAFENWAQNGGEDVARVDLGVRQTRWTAGLDVALGAHRIAYGHMVTGLSTKSAWDDNGEVAGRQLLKLDADFALYLRHVYRATLQQDGLGWRWAGENWSFSAGLQHTRLSSEAGGIEYGSAVVEALDGRDDVPATIVKALGLTGGAGYRFRSATVRFAFAQLVPYAQESPATKVKPTTSKPAPTPNRSAVTAAQQQAKSYDGGRLALVEVEQVF